MTTSSSTDRRRPQGRILFGLLLACVAVYLAWRNIGVHPVVFADEWYYSKMARLQPLAEAIVPSYLYLWLFGASSGCGPGFLDCVRGGNIALYLAATPFIYLSARRFTGSRWAAAIALLATLAPLNIYTLFFMPEASYYFGFCVLSWVLLGWQARSPWQTAAAAGAVLGIMSQVKVHALFLVPSLCLYLVYASWHAGSAGNWRWLARGLGMAVLAAALTVGAKFALGFVLAGEAGLSLLGPFYSASSGGGGDPAARLAATLISTRGHLMALAVLLALPLALLLHGLCRDALRRRGAPGNPLLVYALLMLGAGAGMTVVYAGTIAHVGHNEALRLHMRYYSFTFPLLWMVTAAALHVRADAAPAVDGGRRPWLRWAIAALLALLLVAAAFLLPGYVMNMVDGPDIAAVRPGHATGYAVLLLQLAVLLCWAAGRWNAPRLFLLLVLPLTLVLGQGASVMFTNYYRIDKPGDRAGLLARQIVPANERDQITVVCVDPQQLMRAQFHIDHPDSRAIFMEGHFPIEEYQLPLDQKWMLVIGEHPLPPSVEIVHRDPEFALARLPAPAPVLARISVATPDPAVATRLEGMSGNEGWGRWSDGERVTIHLARPLPRRAGIMLRARAFGDNATLPFRLEVGGPGQTVSKEFRIGGGIQTVGLHLDTDGNARSITIVVPHPVTPASLGQGADARRLGIALEEVTITGEAPAATPAKAAP
jgi:phosphoglycerol transferase